MSHPEVHANQVSSFKCYYCREFFSCWDRNILHDPYQPPHALFGFRVVSNAFDTPRMGKTVAYCVQCMVEFELWETGQFDKHPKM